MNDRYCTPAEVEVLLGTSRSTLARWRCEGDGPPFVKIGRKILYGAADLELWLDIRRYRSTSEYGRHAAEDEAARQRAAIFDHIANGPAGTIAREVMAALNREEEEAKKLN